MSEEEKKAIENLKHIVKHWKPDNEEDELEKLVVAVSNGMIK